MEQIDKDADVRILEGYEKISGLEVVARGDVTLLDNGRFKIPGSLTKKYSFLPHTLSAEYCEQIGLNEECPGFVVVRYKINGHQDYSIWKD